MSFLNWDNLYKFLNMKLIIVIKLFILFGKVDIYNNYSCLKFNFYCFILMSIFFMFLLVLLVIY